MIKKISYKVLATILVFVLAFAVLVPTQNALAAGTKCYNGSGKGIINSGGYHHYVTFNVDKPSASWKVSGPMWPSLWSIGSNPLKAGYSWFGKAWDPFPASWWKVCRPN
ncbi:MAG: hypothetical protein J0L96_08175 [Anaerolineae bacterium]|nr:hypothetical protein [Anaerolineae bacterium]